MTIDPDLLAAFARDWRQRECEAALSAQTHEKLCDAHKHCLAALGGEPERGIYNNMKKSVIIRRSSGLTGQPGLYLHLAQNEKALFLPVQPPLQ